MKEFTTILLIIISASTYAQMAGDTVYYDKYWKRTSSPNYTFYRIITPGNNKFNVEDYYRNGELQMRGSYTSLAPKEIKEGHFTYYTEGGINISDSYYHDGLKEGVSLSYDTINHFTYKMNFRKGKLEDTLVGYYPSKVVRRIEVYRSDSMVDGQCYDESGKEVSFCKKQVIPEYPGGDKAMIKFIKKHLTYPEPERRANIQGRVLVKFIVEEDGRMTNIGISKSVNVNLDNAAIDIVKRFPTFKPGQIEGKPAKINFILPIVYKLEDY